MIASYRGAILSEDPALIVVPRNENIGIELVTATDVKGGFLLTPLLFTRLTAGCIPANAGVALPGPRHSR